MWVFNSDINCLTLESTWGFWCVAVFCFLQPRFLLNMISINLNHIFTQRTLLRRRTIWDTFSRESWKWVHPNEISADKVEAGRQLWWIFTMESWIFTFLFIFKRDSFLFQVGLSTLKVCFQPVWFSDCCLPLCRCPQNQTLAKCYRCQWYQNNIYKA